MKKKHDVKGKVEQQKPRLVAKGHLEKYGENYDQTFASVVKHIAIRTFLSVSTNKIMHVEHTDVKTAFRGGEIHDDLYIQQSLAFKMPGKENFICELQKSIYGLKQGAREWDHKLNKMLVREGFEQGSSGLYLYKTQKQQVDLHSVSCNDLIYGL